MNLSKAPAYSSQPPPSPVPPAFASKTHTKARVSIASGFADRRAMLNSVFNTGID
jgi:hypothetical protein